MAAKVLGIRCIVPIRNCLFQRPAYCTHEQRSDKFDKSLLEILVCPLTKERLRLVQKPLIYSKFRHVVTHATPSASTKYKILPPLTLTVPTDSNQSNSIVKQNLCRGRVMSRVFSSKGLIQQPRCVPCARLYSQTPALNRHPFLVPTMH